MQKTFLVNKIFKNEEDIFLSSNILFIVIRDNQVDAVVSTLTLSCCKDVDQVLREVRRILKPVTKNER